MCEMRAKTLTPQFGLAQFGDCSTHGACNGTTSHEFGSHGYETPSDE